ncbi:unnamed protein product [Hermetia illucens]|uniref:Fas apoptotic inhibitory molecule 1 n=2 Tax=Hermetia illucens TaxID=343691 RepID=A0A7R8UYZ5_HERIL|nr:unnamed protein product [Hermetia illucens]
MSWLSPNLGVDNILAGPVPDPSEDTEAKRYERREVVAEWRVPMHGKVHRIEFEHGTTSGKRVIWVDGQEVTRREWMFKLVGEDFFTLEGLRCIIRVDPAPGFKYYYQLFVDGHPFEQFTEHQARVLKTWLVRADDDGKEYRIVLERESLNIFLNGNLREEVGEFVDGGTDTEFSEDGITFILSARASGNKKDTMIYTLTANGEEVSEHTAE